MASIIPHTVNTVQASKRKKPKTFPYNAPKALSSICLQ